MSEDEIRLPLDADERTRARERNRAIARFVSTLGGAYRAFFLYNQDSKALDEIVKSLSKRFQVVAQYEKSLKVGVTDQSFSVDGQPVGFAEVTGQLCAALRSLGYKELIFTPPIRDQNYFPLLRVLSSKDAPEAKHERLSGLLDEGETKPIALVPITSNSLILRLSDELIRKRLAPLEIRQEAGGTGFIERLESSSIETIPDLFTWICVKVEPIESTLKVFVRNLTDAAREGYFPFERFVDVFPLPPGHRNRLRTLFENRMRIRRRTPTLLGQGHRRADKGDAVHGDVVSWISAFDADEVKARNDARHHGAQSTAHENLELAHTLMASGGKNFIMGLRFLLRTLGNRNTVATQEKALKLGIATWVKYQRMTDDVSVLALLGSLRQALTAPHNMTLLLYPLRQISMDSDFFKNMGRFVASLGEAAFPALLGALDAEEDRGMRRKLCHLLTVLATEHGAEPLVEHVQDASPFLLRNVIMILGDVRSRSAIDVLISTLNHSQKMVRSEAVRSLIKIGDERAHQGLITAIGTLDDDLKKAVIAYLKETKKRDALDALVRIAGSKAPSDVRKAAVEAVGAIGGPNARHFLESIRESGSFISRLNADEREIREIIDRYLGRPG